MTMVFYISVVNMHIILQHTQAFKVSAQQSNGQIDIIHSIHIIVQGYRALIVLIQGNAA